MVNARRGYYVGAVGGVGGGPSGRGDVPILLDATSRGGGVRLLRLGNRRVADRGSWQRDLSVVAERAVRAVAQADRTTRPPRSVPGADQFAPPAYFQVQMS